jgi:hypothetical protein
MDDKDGALFGFGVFGLTSVERFPFRFFGFPGCRFIMPAIVDFSVEKHSHLRKVIKYVVLKTS